MSDGRAEPKPRCPVRRPQNAGATGSDRRDGELVEPHPFRWFPSSWEAAVDGAPGLSPIRPDLDGPRQGRLTPANAPRIGPAPAATDGAVELGLGSVGEWTLVRLSEVALDNIGRDSAARRNGNSVEPGPLTNNPGLRLTSVALCDPGPRSGH